MRSLLSPWATGLLFNGGFGEAAAEGRVSGQAGEAAWMGRDPEKAESFTQ